MVTILVTCKMNSNIVLYSKGKYGISKTATFEIPKAMADLVRNGMELGDADDKKNYNLA